ncbi:MAG TPA: pilin [Patescibacteria group bacterium]|nr:pilin [Patescibacteria group bacterium]
MPNVNNKKNKKILWLVIFLLLAVGFLVSFSPASAAEGGFGDMSISNQLKNIAQNPSVNLGSKPPAITTMIGKILYGVLGLLGVVCLLLVIYAGIKWMLAEGNEETISEARKIIFYAIIGLVITMGAYALSYFVINNVWESTLPSMEMSTPTQGPTDFETPMPGYGDNAGCLEASECSCTYGVPYCNNDSGTGVCECHNDCSTCDGDCRDAGHDGGHCNTSGICECY